MQSHPWHTNPVSVSIILTALLLFRVSDPTLTPRYVPHSLPLLLDSLRMDRYRSLQCCLLRIETL